MTADQSPSIFISYSSQNSEAAQAVCAALEANGISCWMAPRNILPGSDWSRSIIEALNACQAVVLIFSAAANESPQVVNEVERAVYKRIPLLPFRIEAVPLSPQMEYFISNIHWLDALTLPLEPHLQRLVGAIHLLLNAPATAETAPAVSAMPSMHTSMQTIAPRPLALMSGTLTFLFTDIEGSTRLWEEHPDAMRLALARHDALLRIGIETHEGIVFKTIGDAFCAVFSSGSDAVAAALEAQRSLQSEPWPEPLQIKVRMALLTGVAEQRDNDYFGPTLNRISRLLMAGHGGQVLLGFTTQQMTQDDLPGGAGLRDLGEVVLPDLSQPERVFQLIHPELRCDFPSLRVQGVQRNNLPQQLTEFIGREREIGEIKRLLANTSLLTLSGPGGSGKTRLSLRAAADLLESYPDGVWFVRLETVRERSDVPAAIALVLNLELTRGADLQAQVIDYLKTKRALLVLDNFEQVVDAASVVNNLLRACPHLTCLVTSRECLRITGEQEYPVAPLTVPPPDRSVSDLGQYESVQLFVKRCQTFRPDYELTPESAPIVGELCRRLDGIPLAIELAAARTRALSPQQLLQRLTRRLDMLATNQRDLPDRQRTLRGAIDWSYDLLTEDERTAFAELAVFSGGFSLEAAEAVCLAYDVFDAIFSLRDKSLLRTEELHGESRYFMLETIRDYALEKLDQTGKMAELRARHADYFLVRAQEWTTRLTGEDAAVAMQDLTANIANLRDAMDWAVAQSHEQRTVDFGKALFQFLRRRCWYEECETRLLAAQSAASRAGDRVSEARLLNQRGLIAWDRSELDKAVGLFTQSYEISRSLQDKVRMLVTLINLGNIAFLNASYDEARKQWEECLQLAVDTGQRHYQGTINADLGIIASSQGRYTEAEAYFQTAQAIHSEIGNREGIAFALYNSSDLYRNLGRYEEAISRLNQALDLFTELENRQQICETIVELGHNYLNMFRTHEAAEYLNQGLRMAEESSDPRQQSVALYHLGRLSAQQSEPEQALRYFDLSLDVAFKIRNRKQITEVLFQYGKILWDQGEHRQAYLLLAVAERECLSLGLPENVEVNCKLAEWRGILGSDCSALDEEAARLNPETVYTRTALAPMGYPTCTPVHKN